MAVVLILLVIGTLAFHFIAPLYGWTFTPLASEWSQIDDTINITFWVTGFVFVAVNLFMAYAVIKYRARKGSTATYDPENKKLETWLTILTSVGVAAMLTPGLFVWADFVNVPDDAHEIEAIGQQWHWTYRLPGEDGQFGNVKAELITNDNPFGMDPEDPLGRDDVLVHSPQVHIPINAPVKVNLRSKDVLHDFAVAQFRVKMDLVPGMETYLWFTPNKLGTYEVLCEELCGIAHHTMRGAVVVEEQADFDAWLASQPTYEDTLNAVTGNAQVGAAQYQVCAACHGQQGEGLQALNAPQDRRPGTVVPAAPAERLQGGTARRAPGRHFRSADGADGHDAGRRPGDRETSLLISGHSRTTRRRPPSTVTFGAASVSTTSVLTVTAVTHRVSRRSMRRAWRV